MREALESSLPLGWKPSPLVNKYIDPYLFPFCTTKEDKEHLELCVDKPDPHQPYMWLSGYAVIMYMLCTGITQKDIDGPGLHSSANGRGLLTMMDIMMDSFTREPACPLAPKLFTKSSFMLLSRL